ncbi:hypothetical protein ACWU4D_01445 [Vibrio sp. WJH972]
MKSSLIQKQKIAVEFIETAVELFEKGKYFSSLHLAGAAEEIFEAYKCLNKTFNYIYLKA